MNHEIEIQYLGTLLNRVLPMEDEKKIQLRLNELSPEFCWIKAETNERTASESFCDVRLTSFSSALRPTERLLVD
jgi:hypothetical protein